jgi:fatty-acyl-CoA synthase
MSVSSESIFNYHAFLLNGMVQWPEYTIYRGLSDVAKNHEDDAALVFDGETTTYDELLADSRQLAAGFADLGISDGDVVAVWLANRPEWIKTQLAASYLGAVVVAVNTRYRTHELEYMLSDSDSVAIVLERKFLEKNYLEMLAELVPEIQDHDPQTFESSAFPSLKHVIAVDGDDRYSAIRAFDRVRTRGTSTPERATDPTAPACIFYTSGTTGDPKGCLQSNRSLLNHSYQAGVHLGVSDQDTLLGVLPFCGVYGYNTFLSVLLHGGTLIPQSHFDPATSLDLIEKHNISYVSGLGPIHTRLINHESFSADRVETVEKGAIAFLNAPTRSKFEEIETAIGHPLVQPYGLSEANALVFVGDPSDPLEERMKVGGPMIHPEEEVKIADLETGEAVPDGQEGEICLRGFNVMNGYLNKPEKTAEAVNDGWLHTGDLGRIDPDTGYVHFQSRIDDALRIRGFLVAPAEVEKVLDDHPGVDLSAVVGVPHNRHGEVAIAFVKSLDDSLTSKAIREYLDGRMADYKVPHRILIVDELPRTEGPHGPKIQKHKLRDQAADIE